MAASEHGDIISPCSGKESSLCINQFLKVLNSNNELLKTYQNSLKKYLYSSKYLVKLQAS